MTVDNFYDPDDLVRRLPAPALIRIGQQLMVGMPDRDWRAIGAELGYPTDRMDTFRHQQIPGYELLKDWSTRDRSTIRVLRSKLQLIGRHDIVTILDDIMQNPVNLDVVIHDTDFPLDTGSGHALTPHIRGRKELWDGLLPYLESHVTKVVCRRRYTLFKLRVSSPAYDWLKQCCDYRGQQVDIDVEHRDTMPAVSTPGFSVRPVAPSWDLMSPTQLRYTFNGDVTETENTSSDVAKVSKDGAAFEPEAHVVSCRLQESRMESGKDCGLLTGGTKHPTQETASRVDVESVRKPTKISVKQTTSGVQCPTQFSKIRDLFNQEPTALAVETSKRPSAVETPQQSLNVASTKPALLDISKRPPAIETNLESLDLDLRSVEGPSDPRELPRDETTRAKARVLRRLDLSNAETPSSGIQETTRPDLSTFFLRSDGTSADDRKPGIRSEEGCSPVKVSMAASSSAAGPGQWAEEQDLVELRDGDPQLENEDSVSEGRSQQETLDQLPYRPRRRHVYFQPKSEAIRNQFPGLWDLPGFHPKLKYKITLIRDVMKAFEALDGWYLLWVFVSDENLDKVHLVLTVTYKGKLKHFEILRCPDSNLRRYFLFSRDYDASSISDLIDHYKIHPLVPGSLSVAGINLPKLINPVLSDSSAIR